MKKRTKIVFISLLSVIVLVFSFAKVKRVSPLSMSHNEVNQPMFSDQAINGYDAVAYFSKNIAAKGRETHSLNWKNADWYFISEENKMMFGANPEKYAPQFGGFCSFAVSKGFTANTDPNVFEIIDNKLYLFNSESVKTDWNANLKENLRKCETNW